MRQLLHNLSKNICYLLKQCLSIRFATWLFAITSLFVFLFGRLEYILMLWFLILMELSQPRTTFDEPWLTPVVNCNWRLILQLISRASKLLVTKGLQHEPDLTKRSFYWILSGEPTEKTCFLASHTDWCWFGFGYGLVETKHKGRSVVVCGSLRTNWERESIFHSSFICTRRMLCYQYALLTGGNLSRMCLVHRSCQNQKNIIGYFIFKSQGPSKKGTTL